jgi:hypothetical protein
LLRQKSNIPAPRMKYFTIKRDDNKLIIKKNRKGLLYLRANIIFVVLSFSIILGLVIYQAAITNRNANLFYIVLLFFIVFSALFYSNFFEKETTITKSDDGFVINKKHVTKSSIRKLQLRNYVSSESISDIVNIRLITDDYAITVASGVKHIDQEKVVKQLLEFINIPNLKVEEVIH